MCPFIRVLGNHEQNARHYYNYTALPEPEYFLYIHFRQRAVFHVGYQPECRSRFPPTSVAQVRLWQDQRLNGNSFCHHHPPHSSDSNDYGDLWKTNKGTHGDRRTRQLVALYEKHKVDIVWNGHIHSYERTWPIREGKAVEENAPFYMITGGGGGGSRIPRPLGRSFKTTSAMAITM